MKRVLQTATLLVTLLGTSSITNAAMNSEELHTNPRCNPFPECLGSSATSQPKTSSEILKEMTKIAQRPIHD